MRKIRNDKIYFFENMTIGEQKVTPYRFRDVIKTVLWRINKRLGYKYKTDIIGKDVIIVRVL